MADGVRETFKSPTGILASDLDKNLSIKSQLQPAPQLTALPKHMVVAQLGSKVVRCKGNSLLTSTAMRFQSGGMMVSIPFWINLQIPFQVLTAWVCNTILGCVYM